MIVESSEPAAATKGARTDAPNRWDSLNHRFRSR